MDVLSVSSTASVIGILTILVFSLFFKSAILKRNMIPKNNPLPEAPGRWPVIGHLHLLNSPQPPHRILAAMADKYGPIFTLKLGAYQTLLVSERDAAKECLTTNDQVFAGRPKFLAAKIIGYNYAMFGLGPYGSYWRHLRRFVVLQLLSNRRLEMLGYVRESELKASMKDMYQFWLSNKNSSNMAVMEMKERFANLALNISVRILYGKRYSTDDEEGGKTLKALKEVMYLLGVFVPSDAIPLLRWLDLGGYVKAMKKTAKEVDSLLQSLLEEHKKERNYKMGMKPAEEEDFMDVMISMLDDASAEDLGHYSADTIIKATCLTLLLGAIDTTTVTLTWALALLLNHPQVLKKVMDELDKNVGMHRRVHESDTKNLVYLQAVIKETMRLYPAAPLAFPHESLEDCTVAGFRVPKGTRLMLNIYKIQRDQNIWPAPDEFQPERFLTSHKDIDVRGQHFELIPFSGGRRICPGISYALGVLQFSLASMLHSFEFVKPTDEPIDMTEGFGLTTLKATPLELLVKPRFSADLFE